MRLLLKSYQAMNNTASADRIQLQLQMFLARKQFKKTRKKAS